MAAFVALPPVVAIIDSNTLIVSIVLYLGYVESTVLYIVLFVVNVLYIV